jgi:hypothetical protein
MEAVDKQQQLTKSKIKQMNLHNKQNQQYEILKI